MARGCRTLPALAILLVLATPAVYAQATTTDNLPNLSTADLTTATSSTSSASSSSTSNTQTTSASTTTGTASTTTVKGILTDAPDIGAGIPTLVIPYTANAPFMQKSDLPEGTVFIGVGAVLALLLVCVLLWRGLVAWSVDRSVKRAALASIRGSEKTSMWAPGGYTHPGKGGLHTEYDGGSTMSLDALTSTGKHIKDPNHRLSSQPPPSSGLFFSPTAQAQTGRGSPAQEAARKSTGYLPAGYYASPSADRPAGGASSTSFGGSLAPYARHSVATPSPPRSPDLPATSRSTATHYKQGSRDGLRAGDGYRPGSSREGVSRDGYGPSTARNSAMYAQPSTSSLQVGTGGRQNGDHLGGSRAPSAYLDDLFDHHGSGPRERF